MSSLILTTKEGWKEGCGFGWYDGAKKCSSWIYCVIYIYIYIIIQNIQISKQTTWSTLEYSPNTIHHIKTPSDSPWYYTLHPLQDISPTFSYIYIHLQYMISIYIYNIHYPCILDIPVLATNSAGNGSVPSNEKPRTFARFSPFRFES